MCSVFSDQNDSTVRRGGFTARHGGFTTGRPFGLELKLLLHRTRSFRTEEMRLKSHTDGSALRFSVH